MATLSSASTIAEAQTAWLEFKAPDWSCPAHMRVRITHFTGHFPAEKRFAEVTRNDINRWSSSLLAKGLSPNYVRIVMATARDFYSWLEREEVSDKNPFKLSNIRRPAAVKVHKEPVTLEQYRRVLAECMRVSETSIGRHLAGLCRVGYFTGLRLGDITRLSWVPSEEGGLWVDFAQSVIIAHPGKLWRHYRQRLEIPIAGQLLEWLKVVRADDPDWVFPGLRLVPVQDISRAASTLFDKAGLPDHTFHSFRHGFASRLINQGVAPKIVSAMTGQSLRTLARYTHVSTEAKRNALIHLSDSPTIEL